MRRALDFVVLVAALASVPTAAQRPDNTSICDFYATKQYGTNSSESQFKLMQRIVSFAFAGGAGLPGASESSTGILNPGVFQGRSVNLRSWFDGSKATTNLNNQPVAINWLDAGGEQPLLAFLNGSTDTLKISNTTNEYRLFTHFYTAFGFIFGCSLARSFPRTEEAGGPIALAFVHKWMQLNQTHLSHFIGQLTTSAKYYGFSETDASTLDTFMNSRYNVRCAPAVNGQLFSLCQAPECPLAAPSPDCAAYVNLQPAGNSTGPQQTSGGAPSATTTPTGAPTTSAPPSSTAESGAQLSTGAIAGVAIGGAAVLLIAVGLFLYFRRKPRQPQLIAVPYAPSAPSAGWASPSHPSYAATNPHTSLAPSNPHDSYLGGAGYFAPKPEDQDSVRNLQQRASSPPQNPPIQELAEMESPSGPRIHSPIASVASPSEPGQNTMQGSVWEPPRSAGTPVQHNPHASWNLGQSSPPAHGGQNFHNTQQPPPPQEQPWGSAYR